MIIMKTEKLAYHKVLPGGLVVQHTQQIHQRQ